MPATIVSVDLNLLTAKLDELGEPRYRSGQVWRWAARVFGLPPVASRGPGLEA